MTRFQPGLHACMNCGGPTKGKHNYKGVILCSSCMGIARQCDERAVKQCLQLLTTYREGLRVALASGRLRTTSKLGGSSRKKPTIDDFKMFLGKLVEIKRETAREEVAEAGENCDGGGI